MLRLAKGYRIPHHIRTTQAKLLKQWKRGLIGRQGYWNNMIVLLSDHNHRLAETYINIRRQNPLTSPEDKKEGSHLTEASYESWYDAHMKPKSN